MKKPTAVVLSLALAATLTSAALRPTLAHSAPVAGTASDELRGILEAVRSQNGLPSLAAGFSVGDSVMEYAATGFRQWGSDVKVTDNDIYHLGSDTKSMTATVIARLAEQGVLSWDQPIDQIAPNVPMNPALKSVTLAMMLSHRSGISATQFPTGAPTLRNDGNALSIEEKRPWFTFILNQPLASTPGTKYEYSNNAVSAAGFLVEQKTGKTIEQLLKEQLFDPLGMSSCSVGYLQPAPLELPTPHSWGAVAPTPTPNAGNPRQFDASGQARCSIRDFLQYTRAHGTGEAVGGILKQDSWKNLHTPRYTDQTLYALGFIQVDGRSQPWAGGPFLTHAGSNVRNYATLYFAPATQTAIVIATNIGGDAQGNLARTAKAEQQAAQAVLALIARRSAAQKASADTPATTPPTSDSSTPAATPTTTPTTKPGAPAPKAKLSCKGKRKKRVCR